MSPPQKKKKKNKNNNNKKLDHTTITIKPAMLCILMFEMICLRSFVCRTDSWLTSGTNSYWTTVCGIHVANRIRQI